MKYIAYREVRTDVPGAFRAKNNAIQEERKKYPDRYPKKLLFQDGTPIGVWTSGSKGFNLYEATEEQMINLVARWIPETSWTFVAIYEGSKLGEAYDKLNK